MTRRGHSHIHSANDPRAPPSSDPLSSSPPTGGVSSSAVPARLSSHIKKRLPRGRGAEPKEKMADDNSVPSDERNPLLQSEQPQGEADEMAPKTWTQKNQWIVFAIASGACAAFNGVFAKLTTTDLTTRFSQSIAHLLHADAIEGSVELIVRSTFFGLNLVFNGVMWTLFTQALARGDSTTQVSIMNTSTNFFITAILGFAIFSESLPPLWWLGAALLVAGNVIIGRQDESGKAGGEQDDDDDASSIASLVEDGQGTYQRLTEVAAPLHAVVPGEEKPEDEDNDLIDLGNMSRTDEDDDAPELE